MLGGPRALGVMAGVGAATYSVCSLRGWLLAWPFLCTEAGPALCCCLGRALSGGFSSLSLGFLLGKQSFQCPLL